ncbi:MarR family transcriptional regulator [Rhodococcus spelaei]|uniref:MarR family transcriptional regulator n=1 Tax=Rhodococcus spelaei TaxID=2546320 RepID=A0A541B1R1_9NOCA|nr:MarR family transcriptional regulator [Rhodococcus spelaei]TQF66251.1 MarR family transcriptional regulator [Rhodococcus spelaei]
MGTENRTADESVEAVHRLRTLTVELHLLGAEFARAHGLHPTDIRALICLLDTERSRRPATPGLLGRELHLNSASVTALIDRLEKAGHVRRERDPQDRRRVHIEVTPAAITLGQSFFGPVIAHATAALDRYSPREMATILGFLTDMQHAVDNARGAPAANNSPSGPLGTASPEGDGV